MAGALDMTLAEAEGLLGLGRGASRDEVSAAFRERARKCHPDACMDASEAERAEAAALYKRLSVAKRVLMNPSLARPEPQAASQGRPAGGGAGGVGGVPGGGVGGGAGGVRRGGRGERTPTGGVGGTGGVRAGTGGRERPRAGDVRPGAAGGGDAAAGSPRRGGWADVGPSDETRRRYVEARDAESRFGATRDPEEAWYADRYADYAVGRFASPGDALKWSWSVLATMASVLLYVYAAASSGSLDAASFLTAWLRGDEAAVASMAPAFVGLAVMAVASVAKLLAYDLLLSARVEGRAGTLAAFGLGNLLSFGIGLAALAATTPAASPWGMVAGLGTGAVALAVGLAIKGSEASAT